jgi:N-methylhydantoinase B
LWDVRNELLSPAKAAADYGVVIDRASLRVELVATAKRRAEIAARRGWRAPPVVQRQPPLDAAE